MKLIPVAVFSLLAGAGLLAAAPAMARVDVDINVGVPGGYYVAPSPYGPPPRYISPPPSYIAPPPVYGYGYVQPGPVYVQPRPHYRDEWRGRHWQDHQRHGPRWDRDGDGVPNRHDRRPNNPWRY